MIKFKKIIQRASKTGEGPGRTSTLLLGVHRDKNDLAQREAPPQFEEAARETAGVAQAAAPTQSVEAAPGHEPADEGLTPQEPGAAPDAGSEDATVSDDLVNRVLDDIFEEEGETAAADEVEFVEGSGPGEIDELAAAAADLIDTGDEDAAVPPADHDAQDTQAGPPHAEAAESPPATGEAEAPGEAAPATPAPEETDARAASGGETAQPSEEADHVSTGQEIADLVDEISRMDESMSRTLQDRPRQEEAEAPPEAENRTAKDEAGQSPPEEAEPAEDVEKAEAAGDEAPENKREEESAEEAQEPEGFGDSVMDEVDRLLSELGQISVPGQASGEAGEEDSATVTAEEREALLDEKGEHSEDIAQSVSSEVDEAVGAVKMLEEGGAEIEIDFTPEAVGIEDDSEKKDQGQDEAGDVDGMLSSLLSEIDKLDVPGQPEAQGEAETEPQTQDEDFSGLLGGGLEEQDEQENEQPSQEPPEEAPEQAASTEPPGEQPEPDENPDDEPDWTGYDMADDLGFTEDELVSQALAQALGTGEDADDVGEEAFEDDSEDSDGGDDAGGEGEGEEAPESETDQDDTEILLKNLEDSMDAAAEEKAEDAGDDERIENDIQAEVVARSRDVEQAVLDELFGTGTEDFEREIKTELASMDDRPEDAEAESATPEEETTEPEAEPVESAPAEEPPHRVRLGLLWLAYQMNRPFMRWLNPARLRSLALLAIGLLSTGLASLAVALALLLKGK